MTDRRISPAAGSNIRDAAISPEQVEAILGTFARPAPKRRPLAKVVPMHQSAAAPAPAIATTTPTIRRRIGWAETYIATITGARAYLESRGFAVIRLDTDRHSGDCWMVSGWAGAITNEDLVAYAATLGFEAAK